LDNEYSHDVADTFKQWLRELTTPIFPNEIYDDCLNALSQIQQKEDITILEGLLNKLLALSPDHFIVLFRILQLFKILSDNSTVNQMTSENLSIIFGPTLIPPPQTAGEDPAMAMLTSKDKSSRLLHCLIENYDALRGMVELTPLTKI